jgi:hypothetical protein
VVRMRPVLPGAAWRKARKSVGNGACVEVAAFNGTIGVRDSKAQDSPVLLYSPRSWHKFVRKAKNGQLDLL